MITFVRTLSFPPDKTHAILSLTRQTQKLLKTRYGVDVQPKLPVGGSPHRIAYVVTVRSLAELESLITKLAADPDYRKLVGATASNMIAGTTYDEIWRDIEPLPTLPDP